MSAFAVVIPDIVQAKAAVDGDGGQRWVAALPRVLAELEELWSVEVVEQLHGGTSAFVARVRTAAGARAVVKVAVPDAGFTRRVRTLERADGQGYVRLLGHHAAHQAVLLEWLGPSIDRLGFSPERQLRKLRTVLGQVWGLPRHPLREGPSWPGPPQDKAASLHELVERLYHELDRPCPVRVLHRALQCAAERSAAFDPERAVPVHGDAAAANLLQVPVRRRGAEAGFVFVDPDTFLGDPAYDLGVALRDWCPELLAGDAPVLARRWSRLLSPAGGPHATAVWQWGFLERVSTGLYAMSLTGGRQGRQHLLTAAALCDAGPDQC